MERSRIGVWLIGAKGGVASAAILGLEALKLGLAEPTGLVTQLTQFSHLNVADWTQLVVAGHDIRRRPLIEGVEQIAGQSRTAMSGMIEQCRKAIEEIDRRIRPGTVFGVGATIAGLADAGVPRDETPHEAVARVGGDMAEFARNEKLSHVVVVNVASTEPAVDTSQLPAAWAEFEKLLDLGTKCPLPASSLYAIAALSQGFSYVNFTPSLGASLPAFDELSRLQKACHFGCDGKTGETLMKSVLAPMFARRNLQVKSWVGHNIFGNMDGRVLNDPANKQTKVASKDRLLREILGYKPHTLISIEYVPDLGDWKTAWDHIHFEGFLGVPMTLQFIWQGCDSFLAAPLVLDLIRLTELAHRRGHSGPMPFLASFFKSPYGVVEHRFDRQFQMLEAWAEGQNNSQ
jgi:myo-inositol-1-phosphate synthase